MRTVIIGLLAAALFGQAAAAADDAQVAAAKNAVRRILKDPSSARFIAVKKRPEGVCGQFNAKNGYGGYSNIALFVYSYADKRAWIVQLEGRDPGVLDAIRVHDKICGK